MILDPLGSKEHHMIGFECGGPFDPKIEGVKGRDPPKTGKNTNFLNSKRILSYDGSFFSAQ